MIIPLEVHLAALKPYETQSQRIDMSSLILTPTFIYIYERSLLANYLREHFSCFISALVSVFF